MFAGIGSGLVSLKRLGIAISKVIHVEHDRVATHVFRSNHDRRYNRTLEPDGIEYVYYSSFEYFEENVETILENHGGTTVPTAGRASL